MSESVSDSRALVIRCIIISVSCLHCRHSRESLTLVTQVMIYIISDDGHDYDLFLIDPISLYAESIRFSLCICLSVCVCVCVCFQ